MNAIVDNLTLLDLEQSERNGAYTYADYISWKFSETLELIKGKIYRMAAPSRRHQVVSRQLSGYLFLHFLDKCDCQMFSAPFDVRLYDKRKPLKANQSIHTVIQPDLCVVCDPTKLDNAGCEGAPDWIIEILSSGNCKHEMRHKHQLYEESGVQEYWIADYDRKMMIQFVLQPNQKYGAAQFFFHDESISPMLFPDLTLDLAKIFID
jgi:Uma2 family endonuclease